VTFFVGENGSGKSTLLEGIAVVEGFNPEGGSRHALFKTKDTHSKKLPKVLGVARGPVRLARSDGFFLRAESLYNVATYIEEIGQRGYGEVPLHAQSHGELFLTLMTERFSGNGVYLFDEPEAALSPQRQLAFLVALHDLVLRGGQFIIATHSPILMAYPDATIYQFSVEGIAPIEYEETEHYKVTRAFLTRTKQMLDELLSD
jgi:predicted ATPase